MSLNIILEKDAYRYDYNLGGGRRVSTLFVNNCFMSIKITYSRLLYVYMYIIYSIQYT